MCSIYYIYFLVYFYLLLLWFVFNPVQNSHVTSDQRNTNYSLKFFFSLLGFSVAFTVSVQNFFGILSPV